MSAVRRNLPGVVVYELILQKGTVEVLADGSTRDWPPGVDFDANRKWLLNEQKWVRQIVRLPKQASLIRPKRLAQGQAISFAVYCKCQKQA